MLLTKRSKEEIIKECQCGNKFTQSQWDNLKFVGIQDFRPHLNELLELRDCPCKSTLAVEVSPERAEYLLEKHHHKAKKPNLPT